MEMQTQIRTVESWRRTILSPRKRAGQTRASRAKKTPDRRGPKQIAELVELREDSRQTVKTDTDKSDAGRQLK
jgi:hypothetical protein